MANPKFFPVFVNHISEQVTPSDLRALFSRYGPVGEVVIVSSYGFVNMLDEMSSLQVVSKLNGTSLSHQLLHVDFSEELKFHMRRKGVFFQTTTDPMTGLPVREHPACPTGQGIASPFPELSGSGDFQSLLEDKALLDERLKKVNEELKFVKSTGLVEVEVRRSRSRSRARSDNRERGGRSIDRDRRQGERREGPQGDRRDCPQGDRRDGPQGDRRDGPPPRRRSSPGRRISPRNRVSPDRRPFHERRPSPGRRHQHGRRSPGRRQSPGRGNFYRKRSMGESHFDGRRNHGEGPFDGRRPHEEGSFDGRRPHGEGLFDGRRPVDDCHPDGRRQLGEDVPDGRQPRSDGRRKRTSPHRGHFASRGMGSRGRPYPQSRERSPIHPRMSPQREPSPNREVVLGARPVSPLRGKVIVDVDNNAEEVGKARRRFEDFDRMESWEANRLTEESPALEPPEPDLRTVLTSRRTTRQPSDEFEDSVDIDLSKKNMKIQINIDTKDLNNIDRKIVVDEDAEPVNLYELHIEGLTKKMFPHDLHSLFGEFGTVVKADIVRDSAYLDLETTEKMALKAVDKLDGETHFGNTLSVEFKKGKKQDHLRNRDDSAQSITLSSLGTMQNQTKSFTNQNSLHRGPPTSPHLIQDTFDGAGNEGRDGEWPKNRNTSNMGLGAEREHSANHAATSNRNSAPHKSANSFTASFHSLPPPVSAQTQKENSFEGMLDTFVKATREEADNQTHKDTKVTKGWTDWVKKENQDPESSAIFDGYSNMGSVIPPANLSEAQTSKQPGYVSAKHMSSHQKYFEPNQKIQDTWESKQSSTGQGYMEAKPKVLQQQSYPGVLEKEESSSLKDPGPKAIRKFYVAGLKSYINDYDLKDLFARYGQVNRVDSKITFSLVNIYCTELSAVQCICELNGHLIKGCRLRINFMKGSYEETKDFKEKWKSEFKLYSSTDHKKSVDSVTQLPERMSLSQIGEGLKNFDMTLSIPPVHPSFQHPPPISNSDLSTPSTFQNVDSTTCTAAYPPSTMDQSYGFAQSDKSSVNKLQCLSQMPPHTATTNAFPQIVSTHNQMPGSQYTPPTSSFQQQLSSKFQMTNTFQAPPASSLPHSAPQPSLPITFPPPVMASASYANHPQSRQNFNFRNSENSSDDNVSVLNAVQGKIHSMQNKMILLEFTSGNSNVTKFAKLIPGQMFINGQTCLGVVIKSNTFHTWPKIVKDFLQIGKKVWMDVKRLSEKEMHEGKDREFKVGWTAPIAWQGGIGNKPTEDQITLNKSNCKTNIVTASVVKLFSTWGILRHKDNEIKFQVENLYWDGAILKENMSLLVNCDLELGDIVAVHYKKVDTIQEPEGEDISSIEFEALMVWQVSGEVDPWVYFPKPKLTSCDFLITSSTLNRQLPGEKEAEFKGLRGTVEEVHLPAGGIVKLDLKSIPAGIVPPNCAPTHERVYFHRSRVYLNGTKVQSDQSLDAELKIGDDVTVDVVRNLMDQNDPPYVMSGAHWVALSLRANTVVRGVSLAARLRQECEDALEDLGPNVATGRVVHLAPPTDPKGPVISGVAIIDSAEFLGQRVQFDRTVCSAFGFPLAKADLSYVFSQGEKVYIEVKPYNSYCVEKLWTGFSKSAYKEQGLDMNERTVMKMYLSDHGINTTNFDLLVKGELTPRLYIPLQRQSFRGRIVSLQEDEEGTAIGAIIEGPFGELVRAKRSVIHVYGQWMGKADLNYCMQGQDVLYEMLPRYSEGLEEHTVGLVWVGNEEARPRHQGETNLYWSSNINSRLKVWLGEKKMDLHIFKALIDGMLPSKRKSMESGHRGPPSEEKLDPEILAQAKILQNMKSKQFNPAAMMQAIMTMMGGSEGSPESNNHLDQGGAKSSQSAERPTSEKFFNSSVMNRSDNINPSGDLNAMRYSGALGEYGALVKNEQGSDAFPAPGVFDKPPSFSANAQSGNGADQARSMGSQVYRNVVYSQGSASNPSKGTSNPQVYGSASGNPSPGNLNPQLYGSGSGNPSTGNSNPQLYGSASGNPSNPQLFGSTSGNPSTGNSNPQLFGSASGNPSTGNSNPQLSGSVSASSHYSQFQAHSGYSSAALKAAGIIPDQSTGYSVPRSNVATTKGYAPGAAAGGTRGYSSAQGSSPGYFTGGTGYFTRGSPGYSTEKK